MNSNGWSTSAAVHDLIAGVVVFLVAVPLCLGIAMASNAPLFSGILAGIVGGIVVGCLSGSETSVTGPAAGLTAIVSMQIGKMDSLEAFFMAVVVAGLIQVGFGLVKAGNLAAFVPTSVINGLLAAIGVILILKQLPHLFGHDTDPEGEMSFQQPDEETTFSELWRVLEGDFHVGLMVIGLLSLALLVLGDRSKLWKRTYIPMPLVVVLLGAFLSEWFSQWGAPWVVQASHRVRLPTPANLAEFVGYFRFPDFAEWSNPIVYQAGFTIALVATLETLLNLEAVDKIDPQQRHSPPNRELLAQGVGNVIAGMVGGIPMTSVIVRSSVNINAGAQTKFSAIFHGILLLVSVMFFAEYLNRIPLASLAAILLVTGIKLASPMLFHEMWRGGRYQFIPFVVTLMAIVLTDLLIGVLIGLAISLSFILNSNLRRPIRRIMEHHLSGNVLHIELPNQVSFLNRAALQRILNDVPRGAHVLLDARGSDYIDPDILELIREFREITAPVHGVYVSLQGFRPKYHFHDEIQFVEYATRELQSKITPAQVLEILRSGNERFRTNHPLSRDLGRQVRGTSDSQFPLAAVLSCIDSRVPNELVFDVGLGDVFSIRIAGNVVGPKVLGSLEYCCAVAGTKLILVLGHTNCGAVTAAVDVMHSGGDVRRLTGCEHLDAIVDRVAQAGIEGTDEQWPTLDQAQRRAIVNRVAVRNVLHQVENIAASSQTLQDLLRQGKIAIIGAMYDVTDGHIEFFTEHARGVLGEGNAVALEPST